MSETNEITINTDGISDEQKATTKFQLAYRDMHAQLTAPGFIPVLCAHEAAHAVYFSFAGMTNFDALPATIKYVPEVDDYAGHLAAIKILDLPEWKEGDFWNWLFRIARGHAAGGVVARKLMPSSDGGDIDDKNRFRTVCNQITSLSGVAIDFDDIWSKAQDSITKELENPDFLAEIERQAAILRPQLGL